MSEGYLCLILHAHLPFVRHPEHESFLEEQWLFEAITESYIPLINVLERLVSEGIDFRLTVSLSPPLVSMLSDRLLQSRYLSHLDKLIELSSKEVKRTRNLTEFNRVARMYHEHFTAFKEAFRDRFSGNLLEAFKKLQRLGKIELITSAATHGYLPCLTPSEKAVAAQVRVGVSHHTEHFGQPPDGFWLPECAYYPGLDDILAKSGIRYFLTEAHGVLHATPRPKFGLFAPVYCPSGVAAFGRDLESSKQVWSSVEGYPGDFDYRDFYRDVGFDLDLDYIKPYIQPDGTRVFTGIKYYRITGKTDAKEPYDPERAREKAVEHAGHFLEARTRQVRRLSALMDRKPVIVAPYDAELFGHWWFEGPEWLYFLVKKAHSNPALRLTTLGEYLSEYPVNQVALPAASSWGYKGYHETWLDGANDWIYRHLHRAADMMTELARTHDAPDTMTRRALNQAARELLLAQSSDWAFMMKQGSNESYARKRTERHLRNFLRLHREISGGKIDQNHLASLEFANNIFPRMDYSAFA